MLVSALMWSAAAGLIIWFAAAFAEAMPGAGRAQ